MFHALQHSKLLKKELNNNKIFHVVVHELDQTYTLCIGGHNRLPGDTFRCYVNIPDFDSISPNNNINVFNIIVHH